MEGKKWYQKVSNWLFILMLVILIPILIVNMYIMLQANQDEDKVPNIFGYKPFIVLSGSMETEIHVGDLIITKMVDPKTLVKDDVIAFRDSENTVTTHRIIDIINKGGIVYFITKGDNNDSQDQNLVEYNDVEGIYIGRVPGFGTMLNELSKPTTIVILVLGVSVIFMLLFRISNKKLKSEEEKEFLEYKKMKEAEAKAKASNENKSSDAMSKENTPKKKTTKTTSKKDVEKKKTSTKKKSSTSK